MREEVMEGRWSGDDDDDDDDFPSPEAKAASRLALPKKNRGWRRLHDVDWKSDFCSDVSSRGGGAGAPRRRVESGVRLWAAAGGGGGKSRGKVGHQGVWAPPRKVCGSAW